jgi:hypothetical protein
VALSSEVVRQLSLSERARLALNRAFARVVAEHKQNGLPVVLWRDGKVVHVPAEELTPAEEAPTGTPVISPSRWHQ